MRWLGFAVLLLAAGCGRESAERPSSAKNEPTAELFTDSLCITNGHIGAWIGVDGQGDPTRPILLAGAYDGSSEEKLKEFPNTLGFRFTFNGEPLPTEAEGKVQWLPKEARLSFATQDYEAWITYHLSDDSPEVLAEFEIVSTKAGTITFESIAPNSAILKAEGSQMQLLDGQKFEGELALPESGKSYIKLYLWHAPSGQRQKPDVAAWEAVLEDWPQKPQFRISISTDNDEISGDTNWAVNHWFHWLSASIPKTGEVCLGPFGLTSTRYFGHTFWDADTWIFPALALLEPERAARIPEYRLDTRTGARENLAHWREMGYPVGNESSISPTKTLSDALKFPWESGHTGRETVVGESRYQEHIGADIAHMLEQATALGLTNPTEAEETRRQIAAYYRMRLDENGSLKDAMSPDEFHTGDNDLYTLMAMDRLPDMPPLPFPRDDTTFLTYDNDEWKKYQQAAALLAIFPLQNPLAEAEARQMLERFADKHTENGPAMSKSVQATIRARYGDPDEALADWYEAWKPYTKGDQDYFVEKPTTNDAYFLTGAAGCLNTVLYGFAGLRLDDKPQPGAAWSMELQNGWTLSAKPNLPSSWRTIKILNMNVNGRRFNLIISRDGVKSEPAS